MIVDYTANDSFGHFTVRPFTAEMEEWLNANATHGRWWVAGRQQFQAFICIENNIDCMWFILKWS